MSRKDEILEECAKLFCNLGIDSTKAEVKEAKRKELELLKQLKDIDPEDYKFYMECRDK